MLLIKRVDLCSAVLLQTKPRFQDLIDPNEDEPTDFGPLSDLTLAYGMDLGMALFKLTGFRKLSEDSVKIYCGLRNLTMMLDSIRPRDVKSSDDIQFSNKLYLIERRVVSLIETGDLSNPHGDSRYVFSSLCHAVLVYIYSKLRALPKSAHLFGELSERLRASLQMADMTLFSRRLPRMVRWILIVGAGTAVEAPNKAWYISQLANLGVVWDSKDKEKTTSLANEFLWPERI